MNTEINDCYKAVNRSLNTHHTVLQCWGWLQRTFNNYFILVLFRCFPLPSNHATDSDGRHITACIHRLAFVRQNGKCTLAFEVFVRSRKSCTY